MKDFLKKYKHVWILSYVFVYLPWFFYLEKTVTNKYHNIHVALDDYIPFNEYFIIPYLLWFVYMIGFLMYFMIIDKQDFYKLGMFLIVGMSTSLLICTLFPNGTDLRVSVDPSKNICSWLVSLIHANDTSTNIFPSIHVYNAIGVHLSVRNNEKLKHIPWVLWGSRILMVLICMSTVFLKQHSIVDVAGAIILVHIICPFVYGREYIAVGKLRVYKNF